MTVQAGTFLGGTRTLRSRVVAHVSGIILVAAIFGIVVATVDSRRDEERAGNLGFQKYLSLRKTDFGDALDRAIFRESLRIFYPDRGMHNDSLMQAIEDLRQRQFTDPRLKSGNNLQGLTTELAASLGGMYLQFIGVYVVVLILIYLGAQRIGVYRFIKMKQHSESYLEQAVESLRSFRTETNRGQGWKGVGVVAMYLMKAILKGIILMTLFTPAYVIAYSLRTTLDTSSWLFMVFLGIVSNGVLIYAANKFFTFLVTESHRGYVQTAIVKNLHSSYEWDTTDGIPLRSLLRIRGAFRSHAFGHIFLNARFQFIPALKEHASFLVTGLIIIEMALNIQGHLCYELLQQILYRQYDVACVIIFSIFFTVKMTEIGVDIWSEREKKRYGY